MRIALDAMGGDYAPREIVKGAIEASRKYPQVEMILVGDVGVIKSEVSALGGDDLGLEFYPAEGVIEMDESPRSALQKKPRASVVVAGQLVKGGEADALMSMGHSGAMVMASMMVLGRVDGISRAAACNKYLHVQEKTALIDLGLNIIVKPLHLFQFGFMGALYAEKVLGVKEPSIGILSIGEEDNKGTETTLAAFELFKRSGLNFVGNVEGMDLPLGKVNVVVCDGFVGNVALKLTEGLSEALLDMVESELKAVLPGGTLTPQMLDAIATVRRRADYAQIGTAPLLGINGISMLGHGRSEAVSVVNGVEQTKLAVENDLVGAIREGWKELSGQMELGKAE